MRLLHVETRLLREFIGSDVEPYAILSHTWEDGEEISFQEMIYASGQGSQVPEEIRSKKGYQKIDMTCQQAARDGLQWAWVDTCCIDKSSSAELTEAINSMFHWYQGAAKCYVCLTDLDDIPLPEARYESLQSCRWFTRGWTLQELVAPEHIYFFNRGWDFCFTKAEASVELARITSIGLDILRHKKDLANVSVAQKMSWASARQTTRVEDVAYCLLGIFDINMPLMYGEREKAFVRLQTEIIRSTPDLSILAWSDPLVLGMEHRPEDLFSGVLALSPKFFNRCGGMTQLEDQNIPDFSMSNRGIKLRANFDFMIFGGEIGNGGLVLPLCRVGRDVICIRVRNIGSGRFVRQNPLAVTIKNQFRQDRLMLKPVLLTRLPPQIGTPIKDMGSRDFLLSSRYHGLKFDLQAGMDIYRRWPWLHWDEESTLFFGREGLKTGWAALKITATPPISFRRDTGWEEVSFMVYVFGWARTSLEEPLCTTFEVSGTIHDRMLEDMNDRAVSEGWDAYWVANRLQMSEVPESRAVVFGSETYLMLSCKLELEENRDICTGKLWRMSFQWEVSSRSQPARPVDYDWQNIYEM
jgi:hypothetical protein